MLLPQPLLNISSAGNRKNAPNFGGICIACQLLLGGFFLLVFELVLHDHGDQGLGHGAAIAGGAAVDQDLGNELDLAFGEQTGDLDAGVVAGTDGLGLLLDDLGLRLTDREDLAGFGGADGLEDHGIRLRIHFLRLSFAVGLVDRGIAVELGDLDAALSSDDLSLSVRDGLSLRETLTLFLREALGGEGSLLLLGLFAVGEGLHELLGRNDVTDEGVHRADVVLREGSRDAFLGAFLTLRAFGEEVEDSATLRRIAEVVADRRFEDLGHEIQHGAEARDDLGGVVPGHVDDLADVHAEGEAVSGTQLDRRKVRVEVMCLGATFGPVEHDVRAGDQLDLVRAGIDRVLAGIEGLRPDTTLTFGDEVAVLERVTGHIFAFCADIRDDDADVRDGNFGEVLEFDLREPGVDEVATRQHDLFLEALRSTLVDEGLAVLEGVVSIDLGASDLTLGERSPFEGGHDADLVGRHFGDVLFGQLEQLGVDAVVPGRDDHDLGSTLAAVLEESARILEHVAVDGTRQHTATGDRAAVDGLDGHDGAGGHDGERLEHDVVLPGPVEEVQAGRERVGLDAGFAVQGDDLAVGQRLIRAVEHELLVHDAELAFGDDDHAEESEGQLVAGQEDDECEHPPVVREVVQDFQGCLLGIRKLLKRSSALEQCPKVGRGI